MSIQKIYRKYGKRTLASILAILLSVQTPFLSYADTKDLEISSYDDFAERPVWDDSYSVDNDDSTNLEDFISASANKISDLPNREVVSLTDDEINFLSTHVRDDFPVAEEVAATTSDASPQSVVAVSVVAAAIIAVMLSCFSSGVKISHGENYSDFITKRAYDSSFSVDFKYIKNGVSTTLTITSALLKQLLQKLNSSTSASSLNFSLTEEEKVALAYIFENYNTNLTYLNPKNVNVQAMEGYKYYYIMADREENKCTVLYTPSEVAFMGYGGAFYASEYYRYNALLSSDFKYEKMNFCVGYYKLSSSTGKFEYTGNKEDQWLVLSSQQVQSLPFPLSPKGDSSVKSFGSLFEMKSASILDEAKGGAKFISFDDLLNLGSISTNKDITEYIALPKNTMYQVSGVNKAAGAVTVKPGTDTDTKITLTTSQAYSCIRYILTTMASAAGTSVSASALLSFIGDFYDNNIGGTASTTSEMSLAIMNKYVTVKGGGANGAYDNTAGNNSFKLAEIFAVAFGNYMVSSGLISTAPDYTKNPTISNNVTVAVSTTATPNPNPNPGGTGGTESDTTGILALLKQMFTYVTSIESALKALSIGSIGTLLTVDFINALAKSSFISGITTLLSSISASVDNIANWDIDNWAAYSASVLASLKSIDNIETLIGSIADFTTDNFPDVLENSLSNLGFADIVNMANVLKIWNIDTVGETIVASINNALSKLGLATIPKDIVSFKESVDLKLIESAALLTAIKDALGSLTVSPDLSGLSDILKNALTALGLGSLLGAVTNIGELVKGITFADIIAAIKALPASIAAEIAKVIPSQGDSDNENQNDSGFSNFLNLFMITLLILVILIILFINCLRFIVLVFNIPASTTLLPDDILTGIQYLKDLQLPLFGVSLYTLLLSCAYFIIFMTVIMTLRRKIDKIHI